jgi:hypothetical protein
MNRSVLFAQSDHSLPVPTSGGARGVNSEYLRGSNCFDCSGSRITVLEHAVPSTHSFDRWLSENSSQGASGITIFVPFAVIVLVIIVVALVCRYVTLLFVCVECCCACYVRCKDTVLVDRAQVQPEPPRATTRQDSNEEEAAGEAPVPMQLYRGSAKTSCDREEIEHKLVTKNYNPENYQEAALGELFDCAICLNSFKTGDEVAQSLNQECQHLFHTECIVEWLTSNPGCPACRRQFLVESTKEPCDSSSSEDEGPRYLEPQCVFP